MSRGKKRLLILLCFVFAAFTLMSYLHSRKPVSSLRVLSYPFDIINNFTASVGMGFKEWRNAFEENKRLKKEVSEALVEKNNYAEAIRENERLKELLLLKEQRHDYVTAAKVIGRGYDRLLNTVILNKGEGSGIKKDMAVITPKGLVGKIYSVRGDFSEVLLINDPNFSAAVRLQNSRQDGVLSGTGHKYCLLKYIPPEETVEDGESIITSGLDGLFPSGLPVGSVSKVKKEGVEFFQYIHVLPYQSVSKLQEVIIVSGEGLKGEKGRKK